MIDNKMLMMISIKAKKTKGKIGRGIMARLLHLVEVNIINYDLTIYR